MILNPRRIEECISAFRALRIDRLWVRNLNEVRIGQRWGDILEAASGYDRIVLVSDDAIIRQPALDAVLKLLSKGHPVANGYANLDVTDLRVTLNQTPLAAENYPESYNFLTLGEALSWPSPVIPTTVSCFAPTAMSKELWARFPWQASGGADFMLSKRLTAKGIPMVAAREGFIWHVKEKWGRKDQDERKRLYIGEEPEEIVLEAA